MFGHILGRTGGHHKSPFIPTLRAQINDPVGGLDHIHVVLDYQDGVALGYQALEGLQKSLNIIEVETGGGFIKDEELCSLLVQFQMPGKLEALGLASGEGVDGLAQPHIPQTYLHQRFQCTKDPGVVFEKDKSLVYGHGKQVIDVFALEGDLQHFFYEAPTATLRAGDEDIGEELHLHLFKSGPLAGLTPASCHIERKVAGLETSGPGFSGIGHKLSNRVQGLGVGEQVGTGRATDGPLVHHDHIIYPSGTLEAPMFSGPAPGISLCAFDGLVEDFLGKGRFSRTGNSGQTDQKS